MTVNDRTDITAKEALSLAQYVYARRETTFVRIIASLAAGETDELFFCCTGSVNVELAVYGENGGAEIILDGETSGETTSRIWRKEIASAGKSKHTLQIKSTGGLTDAKLTVTAKGDLKI